jgi:sn-glycerol 3-phosphate transport system permease protein
MLKRAHYKKSYLPYLLVFPQIAVTIIFFFWPAAKALFGAFLLSDPFGQKSSFVWLDNFKVLFSTPEYFDSLKVTIIFSAMTAIIALSAGLFLAVLANRLLKFKTTVQTMLIWPYAVAPAMAGMLWLFLFHPSYGMIGYFLNEVMKMGWNPILNSNHALLLVIVAAAWKQVSYNFIFFLSGLQSIPKSLIEAAAIDGAGPYKRFWKIVFPLLSPTLFFLMVINLVYAVFDTFGIIHTTTQGGPGGSTNILVYKVYADGFVGLDLGSSAAQSVILMIFTILLTVIQFKYVEKKVQYT